MLQQDKLNDLKDFAAAVSHRRVPIDETGYRNRFGGRSNAVRCGFTKEQIERIIMQGDPAEIRELSRYFSRFSGMYSRIIQYFSTLLKYSHVLIPHYDIAHPPKKLNSAYKDMASFIKKMRLEEIVPKINEIVFKEGIYFGLLKEVDGRPVFFRLPEKYCRTRFNDEFGLPIVELNLSYFDTVATTDVDRKAILALFPKHVAQQYKAKKRICQYVELTIRDGALCFYFSDDMLPPFIGIVPPLDDLNAARDNEKIRDRNELYRLLIQKLPIDKSNGELLFDLREAKMLHDSVANMLQDNETIDVLTTYADVKLEDVQEPDDSASASSSRLEKYKTQVYDDVGTTSEIFNATSGSTAITYSIKKDVAMMYSWSHQIETAINVLLWLRRKNDQLYFSIKFLPDTIIFRKDDVDLYLKTAQYGFPKSAIASALGFDIEELVQLSDFENERLELTEIMRPLQSSYTQTTGEENSSAEKSSNKNGRSTDPLNEGGRPAKDITERADQTSANIDGQN